MNRKRKFMIAGAGMTVVVVLGAWSALHGGNGTQYRTAPVERGDLAYAVSATGTPNAVVTVQVGSQVSGNVLELDADFNTKVKKGQMVARIDPQIFQARVDQAQGTLRSAQTAVATAQAQIEKSRADVASAVAQVADSKAAAVKAQSAAVDGTNKYQRRVQLTDEGVLSKEDLETAKSTADQAVAAADASNAQVTASQGNVTAMQAQVRVAETQLASSQAQVQEAQAALTQVQADLEHTYIRSPVDGVVVARHVDVGQTVAASLQAPTLFEIAEDLTKMQIDTNVSEADVGRVQVGMPATFVVDAYPGHTFQGTVTSIRKAPINVQNVVTYDVVIAVDNSDLKLFPGMTANVKILIDQHPDVLKVPNAALRFRPADEKRPLTKSGKRAGATPQQTVYVLGNDGKPAAVPVTLGLTDGAYTEVTGGGLKQGDAVIVAAFSKDGKPAAGSSASPFGGGSNGMRRGGGF
jgi:HlyD family secretion protein